MRYLSSHQEENRAKDFCNQEGLDFCQCMSWKDLMQEVLSECSRSSDPESICIFMQTLERLSIDAKEVVHLILETPTDLRSMIKTVLNKNVLRRFLKRRGWSYPRVQKAFREIEKNFSRSVNIA